MASSKARTPGSRSSGFKFWAALLIIALAVFVANFWLGQQLTATVSGATANASRLQVTSLRVAGYAERAARGNDVAFEELNTALNTGTSTLAELDAVRGQGDGQVGQSQDTLATAWGALSGAARQVLERRQAVLDATQAAQTLQEGLPVVQQRMNDVVRALAERGSAQQVFVASNQLLLIDRMLRRTGDVLNANRGVDAAAEGVSRDGTIFGQVVDALLNGNADLGIRPVDIAAARAGLAEATQAWEQLAPSLVALSAGATSIGAARNAAESARIESENMLLAGNQHGRVWEESAARRPFPNLLWGFASGLLALISLIGLGLSFWATERRRFQETNELNQRNQEAILRLLDEMGSLADGDLTVQATVTEDITGAIADSMNYTVEQLRSLVGTLTTTSSQVAESSQETLDTAARLAQSAEQQARQVGAATQSVTEMARSIAAVSDNASRSAEVAQRSVSIATEGAQVVRETIAGMDTIREQIQETSKRIKRLGESSQEIGAIVELINDIAEQTNILALNAAIQAASAGEAGRGFAVVADEVQRLAERAGNATRRIETLVQTIQSDTNEAVGSMEQTTAGVVHGARLAENAGRALNQIENVSQELAQLISQISEASQQQSRGASEIAGTMDAIRGFTDDTATGANRTARSVGKLAELAAGLRRSVADFKLPTELSEEFDGPFDADVVSMPDGSAD
ncbi:MAG: methyl-accepting chemotaxis protein [Pseudoxanthomonas sp.]|nr:methyl-accepting chemotaxis protein [Pseudoxanthomonas sp.]